MSKREEEYTITAGEAKKALEDIKARVYDDKSHDKDEIENIVFYINRVIEALDDITKSRELNGVNIPLGPKLSEYIRKPEMTLNWAKNLSWEYSSWSKNVNIDLQTSSYEGDASETKASKVKVSKVKASETDASDGDASEGDASQPSTERDKKSERNAIFLEFGLPTILAFIVLCVGLGLGLGVFTDNKDDLYFVMESIKDIGGGLMAWFMSARVMAVAIPSVKVNLKETKAMSFIDKLDKITFLIMVTSGILATVGGFILFSLAWSVDHNSGILATVGGSILHEPSNGIYSFFNRKETCLYFSITVLVVAIVSGVYLVIWAFQPWFNKIVKQNKKYSR